MFKRGDTMNNDIITFNISDDYRIIAISDIHGHPDEFLELLKKINLSENDYLVLVGDYINRGNKSKEMVDLLRLFEQRNRTFILRGNHEGFVYKLCTDGEQYIDRFKNNLHLKHFINEWYGEVCLDYSNVKEISKIIKKLYSKNRDDIDYLVSFPIGLEFDDFIFVHAGVDDKQDWKDSQMKTIMSQTGFNELKHRTGKKVVVGHFPVQNIYDDTMDGMIYFDFEKDIIMIDGGCGINMHSQLNALIIEKTNGETKYSTEYVEQSSLFKVVENYESQIKDTVKFDWQNNKVEILEHGELLSYCLNVDTGLKGYVINEIIDYDMMIVKRDYISKFLPVSSGELIQVKELYGDFALSRSGVDVGFVPLSVISKIINIDEIKIDYISFEEVDKFFKIRDSFWLENNRQLKYLKNYKFEENKLLFLASVNSEFVGLLDASVDNELKNVHLGFVYIQNIYRQNNISKILINKFEEWAKISGYIKITTNYKLEDLISKKMLISTGYKKVGESKGLYILQKEI